MTRDDSLSLADKILALVNAKPRTPTREEIASLIFEHGEDPPHGPRLIAAGKDAAVNLTIGGPPPGYEKLPDGVRCRCINLWQEGGDYWCCKQTPARATAQMRQPPQLSTVGQDAEVDVDIARNLAAQAKAATEALKRDTAAHGRQMFLDACNAAPLFTGEMGVFEAENPAEEPLTLMDYTPPGGVRRTYLVGEWPERTAIGRLFLRDRLGHADGRFHLDGDGLTIALANAKAVYTLEGSRDNGRVLVWRKVSGAVTGSPPQGPAADVVEMKPITKALTAKHVAGFEVREATKRAFRYDLPGSFVWHYRDILNDEYLTGKVKAGETFLFHVGRPFPDTDHRGAVREVVRLAVTSESGGFLLMSPADDEAKRLVDQETIRLAAECLNG